MKGGVIFLFFAVIFLVVAFFVFSNRSISGFAVWELIGSKRFEESKVVFESVDGKEIYGLLFLPIGKKESDVVIVLPGGGGTKESRRFYGEMLSEMGYGSLILDQRGIGETGGEVGSIFDELYDYFKGKESVQFLMAKDVVSGVDFLDSMEEVDEIAVLGESMGARYGIIASVLDKRIKGVIVISSAGFLGSFGNDVADNYLAFVNPNTYIGLIQGRRVLMLHSVNDSVIPIKDAKYTFSLANEPKRFVEFDEEECNHGYCEPMREFIEEELESVFDN